MTAFYWIHFSSTFLPSGFVTFVLSSPVVTCRIQVIWSYFLSFFRLDWLGCFSILWCMSMRLLIALYSPRALLFVSQVPKWWLRLLYFYSCFGWDPSCLFSVRKRRTYFIFYGFSMEAFSSGRLCSTERFLFSISASPIFNFRLHFSLLCCICFQLQYFSHCFCFFFSNANLSSS